MPIDQLSNLTSVSAERVPTRIEQPYRNTLHYNRTSTDLYINQDGRIMVGNTTYQARTGDTCTYMEPGSEIEDLFIFNAPARKWTMLA